MCGRFALTATEAEIKAQFAVRVGCVLKPRYNIAPQTWVPAISGQEVRFFYWGLIPAWVKATDEAWPRPFINARLEYIDEKPSFRQAFKSRRCIVPASGYYEWKLINNRKQPFFIYSATLPLLGMAGIWETWRQPNGELIETLAIITQPASDDVANLHERMPVFIPKLLQSLWLDENQKTSNVKDALTKHTIALTYHPVPTAMNNPQFDKHACLIPL